MFNICAILGYNRFAHHMLTTNIFDEIDIYELMDIAMDTNNHELMIMIKSSNLYHNEFSMYGLSKQYYQKNPCVYFYIKEILPKIDDDMRVTGDISNILRYAKKRNDYQMIKLIVEKINESNSINISQTALIKGFGHIDISSFCNLIINIIPNYGRLVYIFSEIIRKDKNNNSMIIIRSLDKLRSLPTLFELPKTLISSSIKKLCKSFESNTYYDFPYKYMLLRGLLLFFGDKKELQDMKSQYKYMLCQKIVEVKDAAFAKFIFDKEDENLKFVLYKTIRLSNDQSLLPSLNITYYLD